MAHHAFVLKVLLLVHKVFFRNNGVKHTQMIPKKEMKTVSQTRTFKSTSELFV